MIRSITAVIAVGVVGWYLAYYTALSRTVFVDLHMNDFGKFYYSARAFLEGADMYAPTPATAMPVGQGRTLEFANMNPPHFHLLVLPIARLQPLPAILVWTLVSVLGLAISVRAVAREIGIRWTASRILWALLGILVCSATEATILTGQVSFVLLLPLTLAWVAARRGRWRASAVWLGVLASLKPFFVVFAIYLIVKRRVAATLTMGAAALACSLLGLAVFGWDAYRSWVSALRGIQWTWAVMNASLHAPLARALTNNPFFTPLALAPEAVTPIGVALGLVAATIAFVVIARD
ncbi:MAG: glycosyltransferase family 87 protein, partial [Vicinamibacterales bacterium]